jgi:hypothetical protein
MYCRLGRQEVVKCKWCKRADELSFAKPAQALNGKSVTWSFGLRSWIGAQSLVQKEYQAGGYQGRMVKYRGVQG